MAATQAFASSIYPLTVFGLSVPGYAALYSVAINFAVTIALAPLFDYMARRSAQSAGL
jgi:SSS family solute:Na+ symporter